MAEPADINVDELRRRARRRLVGAVVLALGVAVIVPMLLETEQKPLGEDVAVRIPPVDDGKFVNRLNDKGAKDAAKAEPRDGDATKGAPDAPAPAASGSERPGKYDTRLSDAAPPSATATAPSGASTPAQPASPSAGATPDARAPQTPPPAATGNAQPASTAKAAVSNPPAATASPAPTHDGFAVQLAAFADDKGANALAGRLKRAGYAAYTEPLKTSKGTLWRVRVGPYASRESAIAARDKLKSEGQSGIVAAIR